MFRWVLRGSKTKKHPRGVFFYWQGQKDYPITYAVEYGNANALISLIRHGAFVNVVDKHNGYSLLMKALSAKYIPNRYLIIVLLLKNGTDVNIIGNDSRTALYLAKLHQPRYIRLLKRFGAEF